MKFAPIKMSILPLILLSGAALADNTTTIPAAVVPAQPITAKVDTTPAEAEQPVAANSNTATTTATPTPEQPVAANTDTTPGAATQGDNKPNVATQPVTAQADTPAVVPDLAVAEKADTTEVTATPKQQASVRTDIPAKSITIDVDQTQLVTLNDNPATVIVGNPSIADISLNGRQLFLHAHSFGETNIMVLDANGNKLVNYYVNVGHRTENQLTLYSASGRAGMPARYTYTCSPNCEPNMMVGDDPTFLSNVLGGNQTKQKFATGTNTPDMKQQSSQY